MCTSTYAWNTSLAFCALSSPRIPNTYSHRVILMLPNGEWCVHQYIILRETRVFRPSRAYSPWVVHCSQCSHSVLVHSPVEQDHCVGCENRTVGLCKWYTNSREIAHGSSNINILCFQGWVWWKWVEACVIWVQMNLCLSCDLSAFMLKDQSQSLVSWFKLPWLLSEWVNCVSVWNSTKKSCMYILHVEFMHYIIFFCVCHYSLLHVRTSHTVVFLNWKEDKYIVIVRNVPTAW